MSYIEYFLKFSFYQFREFYFIIDGKCWFFLDGEQTWDRIVGVCEGLGI